MRVRVLILFLFFFFFFGVRSKGQHLKIRDYSAGYRVFWVDAVGNNPTTITPFLKDPASYQRFLNSMQYNSLSGNPGIESFRNYYVSAEWYKSSAASRFWKHHTIQTGLLISNKLVKDNMVIGNEDVVFSPSDTIFYRDLYSVVQKEQFLGATIGLNRRIRISNRFTFLAGFSLQGSFAFLHNYQQQWDSSRYSRQQGWQAKTTQLPDLKGKNFFRWQAMIPLGIEMNIYRKIFFIRLEVDAGIIGDRYRSSYQKEGHGAGVWFTYRPS